MFSPRTKTGMLLAIVGLFIYACAPIKEAGRTIGHTTRDVTREIGHGTRDVAREVGEESRDAAKAVAEGVKKVMKPATGPSEY